MSSFGIDKDITACLLQSLNASNIILVHTQADAYKHCVIQTAAQIETEQMRERKWRHDKENWDDIFLLSH